MVHYVASFNDFLSSKIRSDYDWIESRNFVLAMLIALIKKLKTEHWKVQLYIVNNAARELSPSTFIDKPPRPNIVRVVTLKLALILSRY